MHIKTSKNLIPFVHLNNFKFNLLFLLYLNFKKNCMIFLETYFLNKFSKIVLLFFYIVNKKAIPLILIENVLNMSLSTL